MRSITLSPSDFAWLWDVCPRCWWLKTRGVRRPSDSLPAIFKKIDEAMKKDLTIDNLNRLGIPAKSYVDRSYMLSTPVVFDELGVSVKVGGFLDRLVRLEGGTYAVLEYKTTQPSERMRKLYERQMNAYAHCAENPEKGEPMEVSDLYSVFFEPSFFKSQEKGSALAGGLTAHRSDPDRAMFHEQMRRCAELAAQTSVPNASDTCETCRHAAEVNRYLRDAQMEKEDK